MSDIAGGNFAADDSAGDDFALVDDWRKDDDLKAAFGAELRQELGVAGLLMAEAKIFADEDGANLKIVHENLVDKFLGRKFSELVREGKNDWPVSTPSAAKQRRRCSVVEIRNGADSGRRILCGVGSKVKIVATAFESAAREATARSMA